MAKSEQSFNPSQLYFIFQQQFIVQTCITDIGAMINHVGQAKMTVVDTFQNEILKMNIYILNARKQPTHPGLSLFYLFVV